MPPNPVRAWVGIVQAHRCQPNPVEWNQQQDSLYSPLQIRIQVHQLDTLLATWAVLTGGRGKDPAQVDATPKPSYGKALNVSVFVSSAKFWQVWLEKGSSPRVVSILKEDTIYIPPPHKLT